MLAAPGLDPTGPISSGHGHPEAFSTAFARLVVADPNTSPGNNGAPTTGAESNGR